MTANIANHKTLKYDDEELCKDFARSDLSIAEISAKHKISLRHTYELAKGESRPELRLRVDAIIEAEHQAAKRLARSRGRWFMGRLIQLAGGENSDTALKAVMKGLEVAGLADAEDFKQVEKQAIEIILSAGNGNGDPLKRRLSGIHRPQDTN